jgi:hypothetical protein
VGWLADCFFLGSPQMMQEIQKIRAEVLLLKTFEKLDCLLRQIPKRPVELPTPLLSQVNEASSCQEALWLAAINPAWQEGDPVGLRHTPPHSGNMQT